MSLFDAAYVIVVCYGVSALSLTPLLIVCWLFGIPVSRGQAVRLAGWGAVAIFAVLWLLVAL